MGNSGFRTRRGRAIAVVLAIAAALATIAILRPSLGTPCAIAFAAVVFTATVLLHDRNVS